MEVTKQIMIWQILNKAFKENKDWQTGKILSMYKKDRNCNNYCGITREKYK